MQTEIVPGDIYGRLTAVRPAPRVESYHSRWVFRCSCGATKAIRADHVLTGRVVSCGCFHAARTREVSRAQTGVSPGDRFGRLVAVSESPRTGHQVQWLFRCDCGTEPTLPAAKVKSGHTRSCGCLSSELSSRRLYKHGCGDRKTKEYRAWCGLRARCTNPANSSYPDYGARGITVCDRWLGPDGFTHFLADMGEAPSPDHSVDRLNNARGYSPDNCAWRTRVEQMNNRRGNVTLTHGGETLTLSEWAARTGIKRATLNARLRMGWDAERTLTTPLKPSHQARQTG